MKILSFIALLAFCCATGCDKGSSTSSSSTKPSGTAVKLQLNWKPEPEFGGFYAAKERGFFNKRGIDIDIIVGGSGTPTVQLVAAGQVPFAIVSADEVINARSKGSDVVAIFAAFQTDPHAIMVHKSRGFKSLEEVLKGGGTLAVQEGYPYAMMLKEKYTFDKVKLVPNTVGVPVWLRDPNMGLQVFIFSEPLLAEKGGGDPQSFLIADTGYNPYTTVVATRRDYLREHPEIVKGVALACREGWESYIDDPKATNDIIAKLNPSMDDETLEKAAKALVPLVRTSETATIGIGGMTAERWKTLNQQLVDLKQVDKAQAAEDCFMALEQLGAK